jgi:DNA-binding transcriptional ArsR family regulator
MSAGGTGGGRRDELPDLSPMRIRLLFVLRVGPPMSAAQMARVLEVSPQAVSRHLHHLYEHRLITPDPSWGIRRPRKWVLSTAGEQTADALDVDRRRRGKGG